MYCGMISKQERKNNITLSGCSFNDPYQWFKILLKKNGLYQINGKFKKMKGDEKLMTCLIKGQLHGQYPPFK